MSAQNSQTDRQGGIVQKSSRAQLVYNALRRAILDQALRPGVKLPEDTIGDQVGASRTIVREALGRLALEGLVELKPNRGASVAYPSLDEARDVFEVRRGLERQVMEILCSRITKQQLAQLEAHVNAEDAAQGRDGPEAIRLAGEFHIMLAELTGNALLGRFVKEMCSRCSLILSVYGRPHSSECAVNEHRQLIEALARRDVDNAMRVMNHHLDAVVSRAVIAPRASADLGELLAPYARNEGLSRQ